MSADESTPVERYPYVTPDEREIVDRFEYLFNNTGGNDVLDLLNDFNRPSPNNLMRTNIVRFTLAMGCHAQVGLLRRLVAEGMIQL